MLGNKKARTHMKNLMEKSVKIKCCYCDAKDNCKTRQWKERSEEMGIKTYCSLTPNKIKKTKKKITK
ncbi:MAG: hypothetical protein ACRDBY_00565 [Cetobacterium sp.]